MRPLPIDSVLPELKDALGSSQNVVLVAPPGSGKTTRIPSAVQNESWLANFRILMLEPRRLAARAAAHYMAAALGERVGETVGYRVRMDTRVGPKTRIEVITEGVLTRLLQEDPALEGVGLVIFDEFHERSLHADLGLALCLQSQSVLREDLRILVMSATLDAKPLAAMLNAPVVAGEGRMYPVETHYLDRPVQGRIESAVVRTVLDALVKTQGDILVFLPGVSEIRRVEAHVGEQGLQPNVRIIPLYGDLSQEAQDQAIAPSLAGQRKIVLATSIAETGLTVEGIQVVIDSGLMRVQRFSSRTGMTRLETLPVTRASAEQRRGRAGRLGPGICFRLWTEQDDRKLAAQAKPEILESDLATLVLELAAGGISDPAELFWLDPPPTAAFQQARQLLNHLGALDADGAITQQGRQMVELALHPRLAHMILKAIPLGLGGLACELAALLGERDLLRGKNSIPDADLRVRLEALHRMSKTGVTSDTSAFGSDLNVAACRRVRIQADHWKRMAGIQPGEEDVIDACGLLMAFAYPDRIAQRRSDGRFLLSNGRGASFNQPQPLSNDAYLVAAELDDQGVDSRILRAAPVDVGELELHFKDQIEEESIVVWDRAMQAVRARRLNRLGGLVLKDVPLTEPDPEKTLAALLQGIEEEGLGILPWTRAAHQYRQRLQFMHHLEPGWPEVSDHALLETLENWLAPHLYGLKRREDLQSLNLAGILAGNLSWDQRQALEECAPTHLVVPSGSRIPIDYGDPCSPILAVRLQEMFGLQETPKIARGRVPLTLHLLSPANRPVQVTRDLASFWQTAYYEVRKDLKGRYPKHQWPDDPLQAAPTKRIRPRS